MPSIITKSEKETQKFADDLAKKLILKKSDRTLIIALKGELGAGKTTFIKGFSRALGVREKVLSPTFTLIHKHNLTINKKRSFFINSYKKIFHIDAYRLSSENDFLKLGVKEIFNNPKNIVLIEWADRVKKIIPKNSIWIHLDYLDKNKRRIIIK